VLYSLQFKHVSEETPVSYSVRFEKQLRFVVFSQFSMNSVQIVPLCHMEWWNRSCCKNLNSRIEQSEESLEVE